MCRETAMSRRESHDGFAVEVHYDSAEAADALRASVREGLRADPKWLPPKWFYDTRGSALFERITRLPEYYPTRAEQEILHRHAPEIATITGPGTLVELGSGAAEKTRLLLDAFHSTLHTFVPVDVSESALRASCAETVFDYPHLKVHGIVGDFTEPLRLPSAQGPRAVAFLGGTIGNLLPAERHALLSALRQGLHTGEWLLLGVDLVKSPATLLRAYDDSQGVTAEFNRNMLRVLNRELGADFDTAAFEHVAWWNTERERIEMWLRASRAMRVRLPAMGMEVHFAEAEGLCTETSAKFHRRGVATELLHAGFTPWAWWTDAARRYGVALAAAG